MRIILSRKGFDAANGGVASPILPSGALHSLPIPERDGNALRGRPYGEIAAGQETLGPLVAALTGERLGPATPAHLDPDLDAGSVPRAPGWKPAFGQKGAAESHLRNQGVGPGDLFLFFGWFREVEMVDARPRYRAEAPDRHLLFGWLQVERRLPAASRALPRWAREHPHARAPYGDNDCLYLAADRLRLPGAGASLPGGGRFRRYAPELCLTARGATRSLWALPAWFHPEQRGSHLTYHGRPERWTRQGNQTLLQTVGQGQEFVLDCDHYPEAIPWAAALIAAHA